MARKKNPPITEEFRYISPYYSRKKRVLPDRDELGRFVSQANREDAEEIEEGLEAIEDEADEDFIPEEPAYPSEFDDYPHIDHFNPDGHQDDYEDSQHRKSFEFLQDALDYGADIPVDWEVIELDNGEYEVEVVYEDKAPA